MYAFPYSETNTMCNTHCVGNCRDAFHNKIFRIEYNWGLGMFQEYII